MSSLSFNELVATKKEWLPGVLAEKSIAKWSDVLEAILSEKHQIELVRVLLREMAVMVHRIATLEHRAIAVDACEEVLKQWAALDRESKENIAQDVNLFRDILISVYEDHKDDANLKRILSEAVIEDGSTAMYTDQHRLSLYTRLARCALETNDPNLAELTCVKGLLSFKSLAHQAEQQEAVSTFLSVYASVLDRKGKYVEACQRYLELVRRNLNPSTSLKRAVVSIILADAGPIRNRIITAVHREEYAKILGDLHSVVDKVYHAYLLRPKDTQVIHSYLLPHHLLPSPNSTTGLSPITLAIAQHNIQAVSSMYYNISLKDLAALVGDISEVEVEDIVVMMVNDGRLKASLDQVTERVFFYSADRAVTLGQWDNRIAAVSNAVSHVATGICDRYPQFSKHLLLDHNGAEPQPQQEVEPQQ